jgi:hypothetical protein
MMIGGGLGTEWRKKKTTVSKPISLNHKLIISEA